MVARFDLRGSEWQGKFFVNLVAWKVEAAGAANASSSAPQQGSVPPPPMPTGGDADFGSDEGDDDLPF